MLKNKLTLSFALVAIATTIFGGSAFAKSLARNQGLGNKEYVLTLSSPLPSDASIVTNAVHGSCVIGQNLDTITYVRPNSSYKGIDGCSVGYTTGGAFCEYGLHIDLSVSQPVFQFSGTSACY